MRLYLIPISHNCIKVRRALELKGLPFEPVAINPMNRKPVRRATGQPLVPALVDGEHRLADSTRILRYLEEAYPQPSLLPVDFADRAACWLIEDWADAVFMKLTRRIAYWNVINTPGAVQRIFFPHARGLKRSVMTWRARRALTQRFGLSAAADAVDRVEAVRLARLALDRIAGRPTLFGERVTFADIGLATMAAPLMACAGFVANERAVADLLEWAEPHLGAEVVARYRRPPF